MQGKRTDTPTMVSPRRAKAGPSQPLAAIASAVTPIGWAVIAFIIVGLALAVTLEWVEALACALAGVVALALAALRVAWRPPHLVSIRVPNERIVAGQTAVGEISVRNERSRSVRSGIIELPIGSGTGEFVVPPLGAHETWDEMFLISSRHRGLISIGPARAVRSDALGLLRRVRMWDEPLLLHVHPRTVRVPFDATGFQLDVEGVSTGKLSSSDVSFHALRDYEPGDDRAPCTGSRPRAWASSSCASTRRRTAPTTSSSWTRRATRGTTSPSRPRCRSRARWAWRTCASRVPSR